MDDDLQQRLTRLRDQMSQTSGAERTIAFLNHSLVDQGYLDTDEVIDLAVDGEVSIDVPWTKIRRGTIIGAGTTLRNGAAIDGENVVIGKNNLIDAAVISGNGAQIGDGNTIRGAIQPDHAQIGHHNFIESLHGSSNGKLLIGDRNQITGTRISIEGDQYVQIGDHNDLHRGLSINALREGGNIRIGNRNSLGRDGGGVISTSYRFKHRWTGNVLIGRGVETTRGAEILGHSLIGWDVDESQQQAICAALEAGPLTQWNGILDKLIDSHLGREPLDSRKVSLYGVVKVKACFLGTGTRIKDGTRVQWSSVQNCEVQERCTILFSQLMADEDDPMRFSGPGYTVEYQNGVSEIEWEQLPTQCKSDGYRSTDAHFYEQKKNENDKIRGTNSVSRVKRIGIVGFGSQMSRQHLKRMSDEYGGRLTVAAACGFLQNESDVQQKLDDLGYQNVRLYQGTPTDHRLPEMLRENADLEAIIISTPHAYHFEQIKCALKNDLHVLVDKPPGQSVDEVNQLLSLAHDRNRLVVVASQRRYEAPYEYGRAAIERGELGHVISIEASIHHAWPWGKGWRVDRSLALGGAIWSVAWHAVDTIVYLLADYELHELTCHAYEHSGEEVERAVWALGLLKKESAPSVALSLSCGCISPSNSVYERLAINGTDGIIRWDRFKPRYDTEQPLLTHQRMDGVLLEPDMSRAVPRKWAPAERFFRHLTGSSDPDIRSSLLDCRRTVEIAEKMYQQIA